MRPSQLPPDVDVSVLQDGYVAPEGFMWQRTVRGKQHIAPVLEGGFSITSVCGTAVEPDPADFVWRLSEVCDKCLRALPDGVVIEPIDE